MKNKAFHNSKLASRSFAVLFLLLAASIWPCQSLAVGGTREADGPGETEVYYLVSSHRPSALLQVNKEGRILWKYTNLRHPQTFDIDSKGNLFVSETHGAKKLSPTGETLWEYAAPEGAENPVAQILEEGRFLVGNEGPCKLLEIDRRGKVQLELQLSTLSKKKHGQFRFARKTREGTYLVPFTEDSWVGEFSEEGNKIRTITNLDRVVSALRLEDGKTIVSFRHGLRIYSTTGDVEWEFNESDAKEQGVRFNIITGVAVIDSGNVICCNYTRSDDDADLIEIDRNKEIVRSIRIPKYTNIAALLIVDEKRLLSPKMKYPSHP